MASVTLDSEAAFKERALKVGLTAANHAILEREGYNTFGSLAFAVSASPNSVSEDEVRDWIRAVFTPAPEHHQVSCLRRLLFEAQALSISDMKTRVEPSNDLVTRKMPVAERLARQKAQEARLTGVHVSPETTPAHGVVDRLVEMLETGTLVYLPPGKYLSRAQEIQSAKADKTLSIDSDGNLKVTSKLEKFEHCDTGSEWTLRQAWARRSLAFDMAGLASFQSMEAWVHKLYVALERPAPPGYHSVALTQIIAADRHLFTLLASNLLGALSAVPGREKPIDGQLRVLSEHSEVLQFLNHLPVPPAPTNPLKRLHPSSPHKDKGKGKGKGKGRKGKGAGGSVSVPDGAVTKIDDKPLCFAFNCGSCKFKVSKKGRCGRGFHLCWWKGCGGDHPGHECTKAPTVQ